MKKFLYASLVLVILAIGIQSVGETTVFTSYVGNFFSNNNLHEVVKGRLYRSAEMNAADLKQTISKYSIRTVLDLRMEDDHKTPDGDRESTIAREMGVRYIHFPMSASKYPNPRRVEILLESMKDFQVPMLLHCTSGTHRSGFASYLWMLTREGSSLEGAESQVSAKYGFFRIERQLKKLVTGKKTLDDLLWEYKVEVGKGNEEEFSGWLAKKN